MKVIKLSSVIVLALALLSIVAALLPSSAVTASDGGIIKPIRSQRLISGTVYMATSPLSEFVSLAAYMGDFGSVRFQIKVEVPDDEILGPRVITWTPQFSIEPLSAGACASVTQWFDGTAYQQTFMDSIPVAWTPLPVSARTIGAQIIGFEIQALGHCTRIKITPDGVNYPMTTTVDGEWINRQ